MKDRYTMKHVVDILRMELALSFLWAAVLVLLFETDVLGTGCFAGDGMAEYYMNLAGVLLMIVSLPFALKLMFFRQIRAMFERGDEAAVCRTYRRWSEVRMAMLSVTMWGNICIYYLTQTNTGCMCALIAVLGLCFCFPTVDKMMYETGWRKPEGDSDKGKKK